MGPSRYQGRVAELEESGVCISRAQGACLKLTPSTRLLGEALPAHSGSWFPGESCGCWHQEHADVTLFGHQHVVLSFADESHIYSSPCVPIYLIVTSLQALLGPGDMG